MFSIFEYHLHSIQNYDKAVRILWHLYTIVSGTNGSRRLMEYFIETTFEKFEFLIRDNNTKYYYHNDKYQKKELKL